MQTLSLSFISDHAIVRINDGNPKLISVIDVIKAVTGKNNDDSGKIFRRICENIDVRSSCPNLKFPGRGQRDTPVADFDTILIILQHLPHPAAQKYREKVAEWLRRFLAGDSTLHAEIEKNSVSKDVVNELARDRMPRHAEQVSDGVRGESCIVKRQKFVDLRDDEEMMSLELSIVNKRTELQAKRVELEAKRVEGILMWKKMFEENFPAEDNTTIMTCINNTLRSEFLRHYQPQLTSADAYVQPCLEATVPITIAQFVMENNRTMSNAQLCQLGKIVARLYREKYGKEPPKTKGTVDHHVVSINAYTRRDIPILREALDEYTIELERGFRHGQVSMDRFVFTHDSE